MFKKFPRAVAHEAGQGIVTPDYIYKNKKLFSRTCPHRYFPIGEVGKICYTPRCQLHNYAFDPLTGNGINNNLTLPFKQAYSDTSGIIWEDFDEPDHWWVSNIADDYPALYLDKTFVGSSPGSWLWNMEMAVDVKHIGGIHPWLNEHMRDVKIDYDEGDGWVLQSFEGGFWLFVFPFTFIEWAPKQLGIITLHPDDMQKEYGYKWFTQIYRDPELGFKEKSEFDMIENVWREDVEAVEKIRRPFKPTATMDPLERHNFLFSKWYLENKV